MRTLDEYIEEAAANIAEVEKHVGQMREDKRWIDPKLLLQLARGQLLLASTIGSRDASAAAQRDRAELLDGMRMTPEQHAAVGRVAGYLRVEAAWEVHAVRPDESRTLCGLDREGMPPTEAPVNCGDCVEIISEEVS